MLSKGQGFINGTHAAGMSMAQRVEEQKKMKQQISTMNLLSEGIVGL